MVHYWVRHAKCTWSSSVSLSIYFRAKMTTAHLLSRFWLWLIILLGNSTASADLVPQSQPKVTSKITKNHIKITNHQINGTFSWKKYMLRIAYLGQLLLLLLLLLSRIILKLIVLAFCIIIDDEYCWKKANFQKQLLCRRFIAFYGLFKSSNIKFQRHIC